jgi:DNA modification methylase
MTQIIIDEFDDGFCINGDATDSAVIAEVKSMLGNKFVNLIACDPPYGNIVSEYWDKTKMTDDQFAKWMVSWTRNWSKLLDQGGAFYVWGGLGTQMFRPFLKYLSLVEDENLQLSNLITWSKKRGYGVQNNYLYCREELAYLVKGNVKKPKIFNIPLLATKREYAGYNEKYPAKSEFYRRTNVWMDVNEIFRGKLHPTQKPQRVVEIPIEVNTNEGDYVIDPFAGAGTTAHAARKLGRKFVLIEKDEKIYEEMVSRL